MRSVFLSAPKIILFVLLMGVNFVITEKSFAQNSAQTSEAELDSLEITNNTWDKFTISLGGFIAGYNTGITVGTSQLGLGVVVDIEDALGLDVTSFAYRGNIIYRFGKTRKHALAGGYFGINRNAVKILDEELELGDEIYPIGTKITSKYDLSITRIKYDYSFYQDKRVSIGASIGLFIMPVNFKVNPQNQEEQNSSFVAPLPLVGVRTSFQITKKFYLIQTAELLYLSFTDFKGSLLDLNFRLEHKTFKHFGFGIGINSNRVDVTITDPDANINFYGDIRMDYTGVLIYGTFYF